MISTQGQKYQCNIPNLTPMKQASVNSSRFPNVSQVVDSLQHKPCLTKVCGGKVIASDLRVEKVQYKGTAVFSMCLIVELWC